MRVACSESDCLRSQPDARVLPNMPQCKAFGCFNRQGTSKNVDGSHKGFFRFPNPRKSLENKKLCGKWLQNLKNASLPEREASDVYACHCVRMPLCTN